MQVCNTSLACKPISTHQVHAGSTYISIHMTTMCVCGIQKYIDEAIFQGMLWMCMSYIYTKCWLIEVIVHTVAHRKQYKITLDNVIRSLTVDTCTCVCGIYHIKIKWLVSRDTSTQYHPVLVQYNTYNVCTFAHNQTLCRDTVLRNAPWK